VHASPRLSLPISFRKQPAASDISFFWNNTFNAYELLIYVENNRREHISQFGGRRSVLYNAKRWLSNILTYGNRSDGTLPSCMWTDMSERQFCLHTSSDEGPLLEPTLS